MQGNIMSAPTAVELIDRLHGQCVFENRVAESLRKAGRPERTRLYSQIYDEYAEKFPESLPKDDTGAERIARYETSFLRRLLTPSTVVLEIGPGRCHLAFSLAPLVKKIYGVDVAALDPGARRPPNFELRLTDGVHMPVESESVDLVLSNQLMEHLHPDDANEQLREVYRVLRKGGRYICVTPSRANGPHDCSAYFDDLPCPVQAGHYHATGLHLKEYTTRELLDTFRSVGFKRARTYIGARGRYLRLSPWIITSVETALRLVPPRWRKRSTILSIILGNRVCATK
jgi:ubiquinone/menaquinone biosynthesis C-methylase UbiE